MSYDEEVVESHQQRVKIIIRNKVQKKNEITSISFKKLCNTLQLHCSPGEGLSVGTAVGAGARVV